MAKLSSSAAEQKEQSQPHGQLTHPAIGICIFNVADFQLFKQGFAGFWANGIARLPEGNGCTVLQALNNEKQAAVLYHLDDTPQQIAAYQVQLSAPGRAIDMKETGMLLDSNARVHVLRRLEGPVQVHKSGSKPCGGDVLVLICCKVDNFDLWKAWWDNMMQQVNSAACSLPASCCAAYASAAEPQEQIAMVFDTGAGQVSGVLEWLAVKKEEMVACSMHLAGSRVYTLKVVEQHMGGKQDL